MENNETNEVKVTTNETEEVVNEAEQNPTEEVAEETGDGLGKLIIVGGGIIAAGVVYGAVKGVMWFCGKVTDKARQHKTKKENKETLDKIEEVLVKDAQTEPMDVKVPDFKPIDAY